MSDISIKSNVLYAKAQSLIANDQNVVQVIVIRTDKDRIYAFASHGINSDEERQFGEILRTGGDVRITELLCLWKSLELDVPSKYFRTILAELHPENKNAKLILQGKDGYIVKELGTLL